jgi:hypothetical protein
MGEKNLKSHLPSLYDNLPLIELSCCFWHYELVFTSSFYVGYSHDRCSYLYI